MMIIRVPLEFYRSLPPGVGYLFRERLLFNGVIKAIKIRFYLNHAERVEIRPFKDEVTGTGTDLIHMVGLPDAQRVTAGDDEMRHYDVNIPFKKHEWLGHTAINRSPTATYTYRFIYEVEIEIPIP